MKKMIFTLGRDGSNTVDVEGTIGEECLELTKAFEAGLGTLETRTFKESYGEENRLTAELHDRNKA